MALAWKHGAALPSVDCDRHVWRPTRHSPHKVPAQARAPRAASHRLAMSIIVYGTSALVVGAGLIGALRKQ